jgi:NADPH:quinone reductase-like Zn-dependent oxidoreductase
MKAIVLKQYGGIENLKLEEIEKPVPKDNEVLVKVISASINDWDWALLTGNPFVIRMLYGAFFKPKIKILGVDIAGKVVATGKAVTAFKPDDEVYGDLSECGFGGFAEYVCAEANALTIKPSNMTFDQAAAIPHAAALTTQGLIDEGKIEKGLQLLINGAGGGVGTFGIQIAKLYQAEVTGVDSLDKQAMMKSIGYDETINYQSEDFTKNGKQYDLILDTKTNRSPFKYLKSLKSGGKYVTVGGHMSRLIQIVFLGPLIKLITGKQLKLLSLKPNKNLDYINELYSADKFRPLIDGPYPLEEIPQALDYFGQGKHKGKIIISVDDEDNTLI